MIFLKTKKTIWLLLFVWLVSIAVTVQANPVTQQPDNLKHLVNKAEGVGLPSQQVQELIHRGVQKGLNGEEIGTLLQPAIDVAEQGLPGNMIIQKAFEGLAKGVPHNRIQPVLMKMKTNIVNAEQVVDPWIKNEEDEEKRFITRAGQNNRVRNLLIESTAHALDSELKADDINKFFEYLDQNSKTDAQDPTQVAAALRVLPELHSTQDNLQLSNQLLAKAINAGFVPSELQQLPQSIKLAEQHSRLPAKAVVNGFTRQIENGLTAKQVIQNLQVGNVQGGKTPPRLQQKKKGPDRPPAADKNKGNGNGGK